jgi:cell wall-associated NlpC family hydrolase
MRGVRAGLAAAAISALCSTGCFYLHRTRPAQQHVWTPQPVPAAKIIHAAVSQLGKPYAYGGSAPSTGFDCSGLVWWCYEQFGSEMPPTAHQMFHLGVPVSRSELKAGDLVFFDTASSSVKPAHVGIMVNHYRFIHSPAAGETVREDDLSNNFWKKTYYGARRIE